MIFSFKLCNIQVLYIFKKLNSYTKDTIAPLLIFDIQNYGMILKCYYMYMYRPEETYFHYLLIIILMPQIRIVIYYNKRK